jgi:hypothetical protein
MHQMRISTNDVSSEMLRPKQLEIGNISIKIRKEKQKQNAVKLSQTLRRIELCVRKMILRFEMNLKKLFFLGS